MATLFFLHALGSSAGEWDDVVAKLGDVAECIALDLPGFGEAGDASLDVAGLVDWFAAEVAARQRHAWAVVGHSMGGKIATLAAARARDGDPAFAGLAAVVLLAASPPAPEPMEESRRETMIRWFDGGCIARADAEAFVDANCAERLPDPVRDKAVADVERSGRSAWLGWLEHGSREDRQALAGQIPFSALIVAGAQDGDLGEAAQRSLNQPHYPQSRMAVIDGAAHLLPYEQPEAVAALIRDHVAPAFARALPPHFTALMASDRVSRRTRAVMTARHAGPAAASVLSHRQREVLAALVEAILPGAVDAGDLARRIDAMLASGEGDGWRCAGLPRDDAGWALGLDTLDRMADGFVALDPMSRERLLHAIADGRGVGPGLPFDAMQMRLWFADARAEIARQWAALPATMARIGYDGFAVGGDAPRKQGYCETAADTIEPWQLAERAA